MNEIVSFPVPAYVQIVSEEAMEYKEQIKTSELITKIRIIRYVKKDHAPITQVAKSFSCHRNTIHNIIRAFEAIDCEEAKQLLVKPGAQYSQEELATRYNSILNKKRIPKTHTRSASSDDEKEIVSLYKENNIKVGIDQMKIILDRRFGKGQGLAHLTLGQLRGIYKRNGLTVKSTRSANGERRHLYDYQAIACFEFMHLDVKHILDKHSLPEDIYELLANNGAPIYQWNLMDVKSRTRFMAYSSGLSSEFGFRFLTFAIQYIRATLRNEDMHIRVGMDNGLEFCKGSQRKEDAWNRILSVVNASVYQYHPNFDIRKNLIERSHRTDDEWLYIPRGIYMTDKQTFHHEVINYVDFWNKERHHTGIGMKKRTPEEVLKQSGLTGVDQLLKFPILILEDVIVQLRKCNSIVEFESFARQNPTLVQKSQSCQKTKRIIEDRFYFSFDAQNVLTYYRNKAIYWHFMTNYRIIDV